MFQDSPLDGFWAWDSPTRPSSQARELRGPKVDSAEINVADLRAQIVGMGL